MKESRPTTHCRIIKPMQKTVQLILHNRFICSFAKGFKTKQSNTEKIKIEYGVKYYVQ